LSIPHAPDVYAAAYANGERLRHVPDAIEALARRRLIDWSQAFTDEIRLRAANYDLGFIDGWHSAPPLVASAGDR
jgi:hypothetical protein